MTGVTHSLLIHLLSPCSQFDQILWCWDPSLGGRDTTVGATEVLGPTPHPTAPRGTELPSPAGFPPRPMATPGLLGCCAGGGRSTASKQRSPAVPTFAGCWARKTVQVVLPLLCWERGRGGWRQAQEGWAAQSTAQEQHHRCSNTAVISMPDHFGMIQLSINVLLITCLHCSNRADKQTLG